VGVHYTPISFLSVNRALTELNLVGTNVFASYIYVVHKGIVRWKAVGKATDAELNTLRLVINKLQGGSPPSASSPSSPKPSSAPTPSVSTPPSSASASSPLPPSTPPKK